MSDFPSNQLGFSGRVARYFLEAQITPLLALIAALLGVFAVVVTPREEEPQINVTMADVLIPYPGASAKQVEQAVALPAEQTLSQIANVEHVTSLSRSGMAVVTVQFEVGVPRTEALVRLHDTIQSNRDWLPANAGIGEPIVKSRSIDDVPIVTLTLFSKNPDITAFDLERIAHSAEAELKSVTGTREVKTHGGPRRAINVLMDPTRMHAANITVDDLRSALTAANAGLSLGTVVRDNRAISLEAGSFLRDADAVADIVVGVHNRKPIFLRDVTTITDGAPNPDRYVWHGIAGVHHRADELREYPAVTLSITKKPGANAVDVADAVVARTHALHHALIPTDVEFSISRNYGATAADKAQKLIQKLLFATASVVALVFIALGRREAAIVGLAVLLTLTTTLFASWAWGFTLNRVSLFALIFSIGILVDDAIVVVENIHRHKTLHPDWPLRDIIPDAVDEVGGPTILATLTVIAALLPMTFVSGLMGPYMAPIPINASSGMLISLSIAFIVTPWLAHKWLLVGAHGPAEKLAHTVQDWIGKAFEPFLANAVTHESRAAANRRKLGIAIAALIATSVALPMFGLVVLKMLPFDNKSEFQVVVNMPAGTPLEHTAALLRELGAQLASVPEVTDYQAYAGTSAPISFNGLVRQYYLRQGDEVGDIQVNLVDKHHRDEQSHAIAVRVRPALAAIAKKYGAALKVVEVPPGPPVLSPLVAEVYAPDDAARLQLAKAVRKVFENTEGVVDIDDTSIAAAPKTMLDVDRRKAALLGISQQAIVTALHTGLAGEDVTWIQNASKYPLPARLSLPVSDTGNADALLALTVRAADGSIVPMRELVQIRTAQVDQPIIHKDLMPVIFVLGDVVGKNDSPLYALFKMRGDLHAIATPDGGTLGEYFARRPRDPLREFAIKWDGEWKVTYETFRDMGIAYMVGLVLIYLLVVAHFGSYRTPLIIMAPILLTIVGVMPGHALLGKQFTASSMIGMIALAGIIVRNSILLVDFIRLQIAAGMPFREAVVQSAIARAQPIALTGAAAMLGSLFILDDPIFNGLAISLIFGILASTLLTLVVIPLLYYVSYRHRYESVSSEEQSS